MATPAASRFITREEWLRSAADGLSLLLEQRTGTASKPFLISVGFGPGKRGPRTGNGDHQECWNDTFGEDGTTPEVFISPALVDSREVITTVLHQMVHLNFGTSHRGGEQFHRTAKQLGLSGTMFKLQAVGRLRIELDQLVDALGDYADLHIPIDVNNREKQKTPGRKVYCKACGFTCRVSDKHLRIREQYPAYLSHECPPGTPPLMGGGSGGPPPPPSNPDDVDVTPPDKQPQGGAQGGTNNPDAGSDSSPDSDSGNAGDSGTGQGAAATPDADQTNDGGDDSSDVGGAGADSQGGQDADVGDSGSPDSSPDGDDGAQPGSDGATPQDVPGDDPGADDDGADAAALDDVSPDEGGAGVPDATADDGTDDSADVGDELGDGDDPGAGGSSDASLSPEDGADAGATESPDDDAVDSTGDGGDDGSVSADADAAAPQPSAPDAGPGDDDASDSDGDGAAGADDAGVQDDGGGQPADPVPDPADNGATGDALADDGDDDAAGDDAGRQLTDDPPADADDSPWLDDDTDDDDDVDGDGDDLGPLADTGDPADDSDAEFGFDTETLSEVEVDVAKGDYDTLDSLIDDSEEQEDTGISQPEALPEDTTVAEYDAGVDIPDPSTVKWKPPRNHNDDVQTKVNGITPYYMSDADFDAGCPRCGSSCGAIACDICMRSNSLCGSCEGAGYFLVDDR